MKEIIFAVSLNSDDVYVTEAFCHSITVHAQTPGELRCRVRDAVQRHFQDREEKPVTIRLHYTHYEKIKISPPPEQEAMWREACSAYSEHAALDLAPRAAPILGFKQQTER